MNFLLVCLLFDIIQLKVYSYHFINKVYYKFLKYETIFIEHEIYVALTKTRTEYKLHSFRNPQIIVIKRINFFNLLEIQNLKIYTKFTYKKGSDIVCISLLIF